MRWPWKSKSSKDQFIVSWSASTFAYLLARANSDGVFTVQQLGVERQGADSLEDFVRRLQALGLKGLNARVMLRPEQYQLLQIDAPLVSPEELRSAARYQIRDMVNVHIDDITLDVMQVGDGQQKGPAHMFVVAANNQVVREVLALGDALHWTVPVIDIQETAQRNLQSLLAKQEGRLERADAALFICGDQQAVLTISANEELFFSRRLDLPQGFMSMSWGSAHSESQADADAFTPVEEYVPDYAVGGVSHGADYSGAASSTTSGNQADDERVQRFVVEVQRSLDLWDRTWSSMPLAGLRVSAGERSAELATWLAREVGQSVSPMDFAPQFPGLQDVPSDDQLYAAPLLGVLLRTETRKL
jgi:MSHA biogenesis protein MshI